LHIPPGTPCIAVPLCLYSAQTTLIFSNASSGSEIPRRNCKTENSEEGILFSADENDDFEYGDAGDYKNIIKIKIICG